MHAEGAHEYMQTVARMASRGWGRAGAGVRGGRGGEGESCWGVYLMAASRERS